MTFSGFDNKPEYKIMYLAARADAISYIGLGGKPSLRVAGWLSKKGYPDFIIENLITELISDGYIDDERFACKVIKSRTGKKMESPEALIKRMNNSGVPFETAQKCVLEHFSDNAKIKNDLYELLHLKFKKEMVTIHEWSREERQKFKQKCFRFITGRGYKAEDAYDAINLLMKDDYLDGV